MPTTIQLPNGQTITSSALTQAEIFPVFQQLACTALGIANQLAFTATLVAGNNQVTLANVLGIAVGYSVIDSPGYGQGGFGATPFGLGGGIPVGTTVTGIIGNVITLSNAPTASETTTLLITDPRANTAVRMSWQTQGAPAYALTDDIVFVRCTEEDGEYNKIRDQGLAVLDPQTLTKTTQYSRVWRIEFRAKGPNSSETNRALKSALLSEWAHATLAASNLYVVPNLGVPIRNPEYKDGQWWEQSDLQVKFYENVTETTTISSVGQIGIIVQNVDGVQSQITVT